MEKLKCPEIRFQQFKEAWSETTLGNLSQIRRGASPRPIEDPKWFDNDGVFGWLRIADVTQQNGRIFDIEQKLSVEGQKKTLILEEPHLILSIAATVGKPVINYVPTGIHDGFIVFLNLDADREFIFQWLERFRPNWFKLGQPGSQLNLNSELVKNQSIFLSPLMEEQTQIGNFFKNLDQSIALQEKKLTQTQNLKKAMLEKMFPKAGSTQPEIRLKGFSGDWVESKLGDVYSFNYGKFNTNPSNGGQYPVYGANGIIGGYTDYNAESSAVIGHMGEYAGSVLWAEGKHFVTYNGTISKPKKSDFDSLFGYFMLVKMNLKKVCGGSGQPFLSYEVLERLNVLLPTLEEQTVIGQFFKQLDETLVLQQQQLQTLKNLKQAFLEKMFV